MSRIVAWPLVGSVAERRLTKLESDVKGGGETEIVAELQWRSGKGWKPVGWAMLESRRGGGTIHFRDEAGDGSLVLSVESSDRIQVERAEGGGPLARAIEGARKAMREREHSTEWAAKCHVLEWRGIRADLPAPYFLFEGTPLAQESTAVDAVIKAALWGRGYDELPEGEEEREGVLMEAITLLPLSMKYEPDRDSRGKMGDIFYMPRNGYFRGDCDDLDKETVWFARAIAASGDPRFRWLFERWDLCGLVCSATSRGKKINHVLAGMIERRGKRATVLEGTGATEAFACPTSPESAERRRRYVGRADKAKIRYCWPKTGKVDFYGEVTEMWLAEGPSSFLVVGADGKVGVPMRTFCEGRYDLERLFIPDEGESRAAKEILRYEAPKVKLVGGTFERGKKFEGKPGTALGRVTRKFAEGAAKLTFYFGKTARTEIYVEAT